MLTSNYVRTRARSQIPPPLTVPDAIPRRQAGNPFFMGSAHRMLTDALAISLAFSAIPALRALLSRMHAGPLDLQMSGASIGFFYLGGFILAFVCLAQLHGLYAPHPHSTSVREFRLTVQAAIAAGLMLCGSLFLVSQPAVSKLEVLLLIVAAAISLCIQRGIWRLSRSQQYADVHARRNVVILGTDRLSHAVGQHINRDQRLGYNLRGFVLARSYSDRGEVPSEQILGTLDKLRQFIRREFIDELLITEPCSTEEAIRLVEEARDMEIDVRAIHGYSHELSMNAPVEYIGVFPVVTLHRSRSRAAALLLKRAVDIALSSLALIAVFPIMLTITIAIYIESGRPIFYTSQRIGKRGRVFSCFKFRSMVKNAEQKKKELAALNERDGILFKLSNDPRITRVGAVLRKYSFDELPQFFNVLRGEMSVVGPRPPIASEVEQYELEHLRRLEVLPGLTGLWQVEARQDSSFAKYIALDTAYVENWSFWLDLKILARTVQVVVRGTGT